MSSTDRARDDRPADFPATARALKRGCEAAPLLLGVSLAMALLAPVPDALAVLWLQLQADRLVGQPIVVGTAFGLELVLAKTPLRHLAAAALAIGEHIKAPLQDLLKQRGAVAAAVKDEGQAPLAH